MRHIIFPSLEWLEVLQERMNGNVEKYQHYGVANTQFVIRIDDANGSVRDVYGLKFDDYACTLVRQITNEEEIDADFVIAGPIEAWREMVDNIAEHGRADLWHTINRLSLIKTPLRTYSNTDQTRLERLFQYNYSIQEFFNEGGGLVFAAPNDIPIGVVSNG